ncbi:MAG: energy transducer TonB [Rickettsiales bacterium]|nr:energy transducer TonB [Rickettsiales bacterium]
MPNLKFIQLFKSKLFNAFFLSIILHLTIFGILFHIKKESIFDSQITLQNLNLKNLTINYKEADNKIEKTKIIKNKKTIKKAITKQQNQKKNTIPTIENNKLNGKKTPPSYPKRSLRLKQEGKVILKALINNEGYVIKIELSESSGYKLLDNAAIDAVRSWKYNSKELTNYWVIIPIEFIIR